MNCVSRSVVSQALNRKKNKTDSSAWTTITSNIVVNIVFEPREKNMAERTEVGLSDNDNAIVSD